MVVLIKKEKEKKRKKKMLDSISPFRRKRGFSKKLNIFQFFISRFGIGSFISKKLCDFSGLHVNLQLDAFLDPFFNSNYSHSYVIKKIKYFFLNNKFSIDNFLQKEVLFNINILKNIRCLKGRRHVSFLPVRGQRNRTNARTRKKINLGDKKGNKKVRKNKNNTVKKIIKQ